MRDILLHVGGATVALAVGVLVFRLAPPGVGLIAGAFAAMFVLVVWEDLV